MAECEVESGLNGLIRVKEEGRTGFSEGWQSCSEGFPEGEDILMIFLIFSDIDV